MKSSADSSRTFVTLVTFERIDGDTDYLPPEAQGACGFMAVLATDEDDIRNALTMDLAQAGLRLLELDEIREIDLEDLPDDIDEHLAQNIRTWEPGKRTVWGTLHIYIGDGEA